MNDRIAHACWLITYLVAGHVAAAIGLPATAVILSVLSGISVAVAAWLWPAHDPELIAHSHEDLASNHPHLKSANTGHRHAHAYVIDDLHLAWPRTVGR